MRDRQYVASLGLFALLAVTAVGGVVALAWVLGWAGAAGLLAVAGGFLGWFYWGPRADVKPERRRGRRGWRRDD